MEILRRSAPQARRFEDPVPRAIDPHYKHNPKGAPSRFGSAGRNPNKPETDVVIPTRAVIKFKAGKELKAALDEMDIKTLQADKQG